jgi:hypothetical protein
MRTLPSNHHRPTSRGAALIAALMLMTFISMGFAVWVTILGQQAHNQSFDAARAGRHVAIWNGKNVARAYALARMTAYPSDTGPNTGDPAFTSEPMTGPGTVAFPAWPVTGQQFAMSQISGSRGARNLFSQTFESPWTMRTNATINFNDLTYYDSAIGRFEIPLAEDTFYRAEVRAISPLIGGNVLIIHRPFDLGALPGPNPTVTGNLICGSANDHGRLIHFMPELPATAFTAAVYRWTCPDTGAINLVPQKPGGGDAMPANIAWTPVTTGLINGVPDFSGRLNVVDDPTNAANSFKYRLLNPIGNRVAAKTIVGNVPTPAAPEIVNVTHTIGATAADPTTVECDIYKQTTAAAGNRMPDLVIANEVNEISLNGQLLGAAQPGDFATFNQPLMPLTAIGVVYTETAASVRKLQRIRLKRSNNVRFILALKRERTAIANPNPVEISFEGGDASAPSTEPIWNLLIIAENVPITFSIASTLSARIYGGIQTDSPIVAPSSKNLFLYPVLNESNADPTVPVRTQSFGLVGFAPRWAWVETGMPNLVGSEAPVF